MLKKLLKYEFKATGRSILPLYGALLILALVIRIFVIGNINIIPIAIISNLFYVLSIFLYGATMAAIAVATILIIVNRFYKNLLCDEGYLMNTLPVSIHSNVSAKLITSIIWCCISAIAAVISILIISSNGVDLSNLFLEIFKSLSEAFNEFGFNVPTIILEYVLSGISYIALNIIILYTSIAIGHLLPKMKILGAFAAYLAINTAMTIIMTTAASICFHVASINSLIDRIVSNSPLTFMHILGIGSFFIQVAWFIVLYVATHYILKNKLNLE